VSYTKAGAPTLGNLRGFYALFAPFTRHMC
jgi:hypothetical protein